jgi:DNA-binding FadR family transcriptional regulator
MGELKPRGRRGAVERPKKTAVLLAQRIVRDIVETGLSPGSMLPPEQDLADELGVGRATLREALRYLELQGVLAIQAGPRGGPMVATPSPKPLASTFALLLEMSRSPFADIVAARVTFEPILAADAALSINADQLDSLQEVCREMSTNIQRPDIFLECNARFHQLIAQSSGNRVFEYVVASLSWISDGSTMGVEYRTKEREAVADAHQRVVDAIKSGDPDVAKKMMYDHMVEFETYIRKRYPELLSKTVRWDDHI